MSIRASVWLLWLVLGLFTGCTTTDVTQVTPKTEAEQVADIKQRLLDTHRQLHLQRAAVHKLINNETDLELLLRLMNSPDPAAMAAVREQADEDSNEQKKPAEPVKRIDRLQVMLANQVALKNELRALLQQLEELQTQ